MGFGGWMEGLGNIDRCNGNGLVYEDGCCRYGWVQWGWMGIWEWMDGCWQYRWMLWERMGVMRMGVGDMDGWMLWEWVLEYGWKTGVWVFVWVSRMDEWMDGCCRVGR